MFKTSFGKGEKNKKKEKRTGRFGPARQQIGPRARTASLSLSFPLLSLTGGTHLSAGPTRQPRLPPPAVADPDSSPRNPNPNWPHLDVRALELKPSPL
jgi:hypothetical protein